MTSESDRPPSTLAPHSSSSSSSSSWTSPPSSVLRSNPYASKAGRGPRRLSVATTDSEPATPWSEESKLLPVSQSQRDPTAMASGGAEGSAVALTSPYVSSGNGSVGNAGKPSSEALRANPYARSKKRDGTGITAGGVGAAVSVGSGSSAGGANGKRSKPKGAASRILTPEERMMLREALPPNMPVFDRFFCALLRSSPADYRASLNHEGRATDLWRTVCQRVNVIVPAETLATRYPPDQLELHFSHRAALVLEEARQAIAQGLVAPPSGGGRGAGGAAAGMTLPIHNVETTNTMGTSKVTFTKRSKFTPEELSMIRPGNVLELTSRDFFERSEARSVLAVVASSNREQIEKKGLFLCLVFDPYASMKHGQDWKVKNVASCISECRCFDAMTSAVVRSSALVLPLLGHQPCDTDSSNANTNETGSKSITDFFGRRQASDLNETQEIASRTFLQSAPNRVTLIQGPPGTGKTTLLVTIIRRYLEQAHSHDCEDSSRPLIPRRLLVCAPTNKAVVVLASRFLKAIGNSKTNCVLVGDADKLLENGRESPLRRIFLYSWMQVIIEEYRKLRNAFLPGSSKRSMKSLHETAHRLQTQLIRNLACYESKGVIQATAQISNLLQKQGNGDEAYGIVPKIESLIKQLEMIPNDLVYRQVLNKAEVIFCTLSCSGGAVFRTTNSVNDLIVDEAAAATEPEVCVPLHLRPSRVLLVGDPLQLPATILSRQAATLGLAKSLQERLMLDCEYPHVMLNIQYRMRPDISHFPSSRFYGSKLLNGGNVSSPSYGISGKGNSSDRVLFGGRPYTFLQVAGVEEQGAGGSFRNPAEAQVVVDLLLRLRDEHDKEWLSANRVRVITYYQAQVGLLKRLFWQNNLSDVVVATVDSSQGCESDVVLVSLVRSCHANSGKAANANVGFLADDRRMNVSLTRARFQLVCVGNARQLQSCASETIRLLATDAHDRGCVLPFPSPHAASSNQGFARHPIYD